ncbi:MAG: glycosyltransferase, partial [Patescibacteria group bacterium]
MRIALVHDYIKEYGGAERVLEVLHEVFPDAPIFTTVYLPEFLGPHQERFEKWKIKTSFLQGLPLKAKLISPFRILAPFVFKTFDFSQYDLIITSATGAYNPNVLNKKSAKLICYCHTPPRYLYGFATAREWKNNLFLRVFGELANHFLRLVDFRSSQNVDYFIANSENVAGRIKKFYRKDSTVIYPPVDTASSGLGYSVELKEKKLNAVKLNAKRYYLAGGRLARPKHIDLIVETFSKLNMPLKVFGRGFAGYELEIKSKVKSQKSKVEFLGEVTDEEKLELMKNAKAFVFASEDEDFGITPVEAMGVGTPVIAYRSGGVLETVVDPSAGSGQAATGLF